MRHWTHDELHALMDSNQGLKAKSERAHALLQVTSMEKEHGKLQMMEIYAEAIGCKRADAAKEYIKKVFTHLRRRETWDAVRYEYASQKLCHSPLGNDYVCYCDESRAA